MRTRTVGTIAAISVVALVATACTNSESATSAANGHLAANAKAKPSPAPTPPPVTIFPADGAKNADPSAGVTVTAVHGRLQAVTVTPVGGTAASSGNPSGPVTGSLNADGTSWHTQWALGVSQRYAVTATATVNGKASTTTSTFTTLTPNATFSTHIFEAGGQQYGVGMPILLQFSQPIKDKVAVEQALEIKTSTPVIGAWYWDNSQTLAFRPRDY